MYVEEQTVDISPVQRQVPELSPRDVWKAQLTEQAFGPTFHVSFR
jgi:hypothetical protein